MFFAFALLAEWRPVPIDPAGRRDVSLAFVFIIATQLLFGWEWSVLSGAAGIGLAMASPRASAAQGRVQRCDLRDRGRPRRSRARCSAPASGYGYGEPRARASCSRGDLRGRERPARLPRDRASHGARRCSPIFLDHLRHSGPIFGIMVFVAAQAVIFWRLSPPLVLLLGAPLFALTLYQRSSCGTGWPRRRPRPTA